jgi:hypothetical protein
VYRHTFVLETSVSVADLSFSRFDEINDRGAQANVVQNFVCIFFIDLVYESLIGWDTKVLWEGRNCILENLVQQI